MIIKLFRLSTLKENSQEVTRYPTKSQGEKQNDSAQDKVDNGCGQKIRLVDPKFSIQIAEECTRAISKKFETHLKFHRRGHKVENPKRAVLQRIRASDYRRAAKGHIQL